MQTFKEKTVLLVGGYGFFGKHLARRICRNPALHVIVAGRSLSHAETLVRSLVAEGCASRISAVAVDTSAEDLPRVLYALGVSMVVNFSGPFQGGDYRVARACIDAGVHYIDLADAREYVLGIKSLDHAAREANVLVVSGASSVPALSSAVLDSFRNDMRAMTDIDIGISPGNRTDRGRATVEAILSYCGEPVPVWRDGDWSNASGWVKHVRRNYPEPVGSRWLTLCDVPDLALHVTSYPGVQNVMFRAGLELRVLHFGLGLMSLLRKKRLVPNLRKMAGFAKWASERLIQCGSDAGAMHVEVRGLDHDGRPASYCWTLLATAGDGPYVPTLAAAALISRLANGSMTEVGARPCTGLLTLNDFQKQYEGLSIHTTKSRL